MSNYDFFSKWVDSVLKNIKFSKIKALNFNLYEEENTYSIQLIATDYFNIEDEDWACYEKYSSGENLCTYSKDEDWIKFQEKCKFYITKYVHEGRYANELQKLLAIGVGFVDGDIEFAYLQEK